MRLSPDRYRTGVEPGRVPDPGVLSSRANFLLVDRPAPVS